VCFLDLLIKSLVLQLRRTHCLRAGLRKFKVLLFRRKVRGTDFYVFPFPSSIPLRIHFSKLKFYQQSRKNLQTNFRRASEHYYQQSLRLGIQSFQFNITHNKFKGISLHSPQRLLLSSMTSSMMSSRYDLNDIKTNSSPHLLQYLGKIVPLLHCSTLFTLSSFQLDNFRKRSGYGLYWILKWHQIIRRKIHIRLLIHFADSYYRYKGWYHWRYSYWERKKYLKRYQQDKLHQGKQHFQRNYLPLFWRIWKHRTRILGEQNRISFYFRARNALRRLRMKSQRTSRIRVLLIQRTIRSEVSQLLYAIEWWRVWSKRRKGFRQLRMVNDFIRSEMKEERMVLDSNERFRLKQFYFSQWHRSHDHRKRQIMEWQNQFEKKILRICWGYWRFRMARHLIRGREKVSEDLVDISLDQFTKYHMSDTSPSATPLRGHGKSDEGEVSRSEQEISPQFIFSSNFTSENLQSPSPPSPPSHVFPHGSTTKGPKLSLQELSESIQRVPRHSSPKFTFHFIHTSNSLSSPTPTQLLKRTIDTSHALTRGYLTRYEHLQRLKSLHHQNR
jgi:hypothetical protein